MTTIITVCTTCKRKTDAAEDGGIPDGERLADSVELAARDRENVQVRRHNCLMGCDFACNVTIQDPTKISYAVGMFEPTCDAAEAIVDYAALHAESETGQVPYRTWPQGIKGHFRSRMLPVTAEDA